MQSWSHGKGFVKLIFIDFSCDMSREVSQISQQYDPDFSYMCTFMDIHIIIKLNRYAFYPLTGTKEAAFIHAVTAAGVMHAVTQSCSAGNLTDCSCDMTREGLTNPAGWKWGGCSDNVDYGIWFSRTFVDAPEEQLYNATGDVRALMNLHNNRAGRMVRHFPFS